MGHHSGHLDHVAQLDLAPGSARRRPLERPDQAAGLEAQRRQTVADLAEHLAELALGLASLALDLLELALDLDELLAHRLHQPAQLERPLLHLAGRSLGVDVALRRDLPPEGLAGLAQDFISSRSCTRLASSRRR